VTVHPTLVLGPSLIAEKNSSVEAIYRIMSGSIPGVPNIMFPCVDVRDVAQTHWLAFRKEGINGERFLSNIDSYWIVDIAKTLKEEF